MSESNEPIIINPEMNESALQILILSYKFIRDWQRSPGMGLLAGMIRPVISMERVRQLLNKLEIEGLVKRIPGNKSYAGFEITPKGEKYLINNNLI